MKGGRDEGSGGLVREFADLGGLAGAAAQSGQEKPPLKLKVGETNSLHPRELVPEAAKHKWAGYAQDSVKEAACRREEAREDTPQRQKSSLGSFRSRPAGFPACPVQGKVKKEGRKRRAGSGIRGLGGSCRRGSIERTREAPLALRAARGASEQFLAAAYFPT